MTEINENEQANAQETGNTGETPGTDPTPTPPTSTSVVNLAVEAVMDMIDAMKPFATITRGALGIGNGLCCEIAPTNTDTVFMDKES